MKILKFLLLLITVITFTSCKEDNNSSSEDETELTTTDEDGNEVYSDGTYCADVEYYNPDTGTRSTYTLNVEVENNELTVIHWPNGGWLDENHFTPEELDSSGSCSFTSDQGYEYTVQITGPECDFTDEVQAQYDSEEDQAATTCPECGGTKEDYDDLCYDCKNKQEEEEEQNLLDQE